MRIIGPDELVFGVDDLNACRTFLVDYGLDEETWEDGKGGTFVALDNTAITVRARNDSSLPKPLPSGSTLRQTIYGVEDASVLDEIEAELSTDREVTRDGNGAIALWVGDDAGTRRALYATHRAGPVAASGAVTVGR